MVLHSPVGTTEISGVSAVPTGLWLLPTLFPALKCRAIFVASRWDARTRETLDDIPGTKLPDYFYGVPLGREITGEHARTWFIRFSGNVSATNDEESVFSSAEQNPAEYSAPMLFLCAIPGDAVGVFHLRAAEKIQGAAVGQVDAAMTETVDEQ